MTTKIRWLIALIAVLIVTNIFLLLFIWKLRTGADDQKISNESRKYLIENAQMTSTQVTLFDSLRKNHFEEIGKRQKLIAFIKDRLVDLLKAKGKDSAKKRLMAVYLTEKLGQLQSEMDMETYQHFSQLRSILNEEQKKRFDSTIKEIVHSVNSPAKTR